jgi:hypothetical protein
MANKLHTWLFGLIYPAFLGTVFVNLFSSGFPWPSDLQITWGIALTIYFLTQFGEGIESKSEYSRETAAFDMLEVIAMIFAFFWLGSLSVQSNWDTNWLLVKGGIIVALIIPPIKRFQTERELNFLSLQSGIAIILTLMPGFLGVIGFTMPLALYFIALLNSDLMDWLKTPLPMRRKANSTAAK